MTEQDVPLEERIKRIDNADDLAKLLLTEFFKSVDRLCVEAETNLTLRTALLSDPHAELKKRGVPTLPGSKVRFFEQESGEFVIPLAPYRGDKTGS